MSSILVEVAPSVFVSRTSMLPLAEPALTLPVMVMCVLLSAVNVILNCLLANLCGGCNKTG